jgi:hypothetical protein
MNSALNNASLLRKRRSVNYVAVAEFRSHLPRTPLKLAAGASGQSDLHHRKGHSPPEWGGGKPFAKISPTNRISS